jgi:hypothetical protein
MPQNVSAVISAWNQAKSDLATFKTTLATLITNLATLEADRDSLYALGAGDVADWLSTQIQQAQIGFQPRVSSGGGVAPQVVRVMAPAPGARDLSVTDQRPISSTQTGAWANLS